MLCSHWDPKINLSRKRDTQRTSKRNLWEDVLQILFTAGVCSQLTSRYRCCGQPDFCFVLSLCPITQFFPAAAAVLLLSSATWPLPALLLPLLVKPFHALIPDVLSKVMNHTCTSESLLTNEAYAPNSAVLS